MSIRYWFPSDEEQNGALGVAISDEDGGFVAGAMKCFAGLALAGVLAANTLAAQLPYADGWQVDERVVPATLLVDETEFIPRLQPAAPITWAATAIFDDDSDFVSVPVVALDEGQWMVTVPAQVLSARAVTDDDQYIGSLGVDDDGRWPAGAPASPLAVRAIADDEQYVGYLGTDEDGWLPPVLSAIARPLTFRDESDFVVPASVAIENYEWPAVQLVPVAPAIARAITDDLDFVAPVLGTLVDQDTGWWRQLVYTVPLQISQLFADDSDCVALLMAFDGRMLSEPQYDGTIASVLQFDGNVAFAVLLDGRLTIYPA